MNKLKDLTILGFFIVQKVSLPEIIRYRGATKYRKYKGIGMNPPYGTPINFQKGLDER